MVDSIVSWIVPWRATPRRNGSSYLPSCIAKGGCAVLRSTRGVALLTLALINVFTLVAGVTLVRMLPSRLAMLKPVQVASRPEVGASPAMANATGGAMPTGSGLDSALSGVLSSASLGSGVAAEVADQSG